MATSAGTLLFLMDRWSSAAGGIQTVNRELCIAVAREIRQRGDQLCVTCLVQRALRAEIEAARQSGVELLQARAIDVHGDDSRVITNMVHPTLSGRKVLGVIGHSKFTGKAARTIRDEYFPGARVVMFMHMDPEETESVKEEWLDPQGADVQVRDLEQRLAMELEYALDADIVVPIGPRLGRRANDLLRAEAPTRKFIPEVREMLCGMHERRPRDAVPQQPVVLALGRTDHIRVKGLDIFADAAGLVIRGWHDSAALKERPEPRFVVRGGGPHADALQVYLRERAAKLAGRTVNLTVKPYTQDEEDLQRDARQASVLVMPSRAEGFGLAALEACSWGVPILVNRWSGVGEVLYEQLPAWMAREAVLLDISGSDELDATNTAARVMPFLHNDEWAHSIGLRLRELLLPLCSWSRAGRNLLSIVVGVERPAREIVGETLSDAATATVGDVAEICAVNDPGGNVVHAYCDGERYTAGGNFLIHLHFELRAVKSGHVSSIRVRYEDGRYEIGAIRQWLNYEERRLEGDRLALPIYLEKGKVLDVHVVARLRCEGEPGCYRAVDYGKVCIEIDADGTSYTIEGAISRGGILLLGEQIANWDGTAELD